MLPRVLIFTIVSIVVLAGFLIYSKFIDQPNPSSLISSTVSSLKSVAPSSLPQPTSSPVPFIEMTIPHLKARNYESKLGSLQKVSENSNYTSYLTSYTSDGLKVNGLLTQPKGEMPEGGWPAVIFIHGYIPPAQYRTLEKYSDYVNFLARNGLVVFKIDLRGHGDSEGEGGGAYYSEDYVVDALNGRAALQSSDFVNKEKIGLWGHSMAGNVVSRALAAKPEIKAVVIWAGAGYTYTDIAEYQIEDNSYKPLPPTSEVRQKRNELLETHGGFNPESEFWKQVPATNYLDGIKGAIQLHHAINDDVVSVEYSRNLDRILDKTSIPHEIHEYLSGGHNLIGSSFNQAMQRTVDFYKKYLD